MTRLALSALALAVVLGGAPAAAAEPSGTQPDVVFILLDTTRADRMSAWGNPRPTTPNLDALARTGVRFARHFANSHATRPSMPQLMSGRYYQPSILRDFRPRTHPRDWPFAAPDPSMALLPEILDQAGYHLAAVSAHPWVSRESRLGAPFDVFEEPDVPARRGHADARVLVDRGLALWRARPNDRPTFLYLHFMDSHIPRHVAPGELRFGREDPAARVRFDEAGEPDMGSPWRDWDRSDARAFTPADVEFFTAVYDTILARLDAEIGRLVAGVRAEDPELRRTLVVVTADHGEELGEHGRVSHEASLDDAVQHIPWIVSGRGIPAGQTAWGVTENVDVVPTLLQAIGLAPPAATRFDGRAMLADGRVCSACLRSVAVYAWEDYRGVRLGTRLIREELAASLAARCLGARRLLGPERRPVPPDPARLDVGARILSRSLDPPEQRFRSGRYTSATGVFSVLPPFWRVVPGVAVACVAAGPDTPRTAFAADGWIWTGRGLTVLQGAATTPPLRLELEVPDGEYEVALGVRDLPPPPRFFGYDHWLEKRLRRRQPKARVALGRLTATGGQLRLDVPAAAAAGHHVLAIHLRPHGLAPEPSDPPAGDPALRERLRSLGYVD